MKNLPQWAKLLILVLTFAAMFGILKWVDYLSTVRDMPAPDGFLAGGAAASVHTEA